MARKAEPGIDFYRLDCAHIRNKKIRLLFNDHGADGYWIWQCILSSAYEGKGYYFDLNDEDSLELFAADVCKKELTLVMEVIKCCVKRGLFDSKVFGKSNILTSEMMQDNYLFATSERRKKGTIIDFFEDYISTKIQENERNVKIVPGKNTHTDLIPPGNNPHSIVEYSIVKDSIVDSVSKETLGDQSPEIKKELLEKYNSIPKDKKAIHDFIKNNNPSFPDPYMALWNLFAGQHNLPLVKEVTELRKKKLSTRLKESSFDFIQIMRKANQANDFMLTGNWFTFDWIFHSQVNYMKIIEGNFDKKDIDPKVKPITAADEIRAARERSNISS
ncbi:DUF4373 domain-containing protein [Flavitalea sp.]|nr:DUF4373 domain-containing protein [Flavitalea sp.]